MMRMVDRAYVLLLTIALLLIAMSGRGGGSDD